VGTGNKAIHNVSLLRMNGVIPPLLHVPYDRDRAALSLPGALVCSHSDVLQFKSTRAARARRGTEVQSIREFPRTADGSGLARTLASLQANKPRSDETALGQSLRVLPLPSPLKLRFAVAEWSREALTYWLVSSRSFCHGISCRGYGVMLIPPCLLD